MKTLIRFVFVCALGWFLAASGARAETPRVVPSSAAQVQLSYAPLVKNAAPAVVNIYTRKVIRQRVLSPFMGDPFFQHFFGDAAQGAPVRQRLESSLGSGVIVRPDGLIVTSNHVIAGADQITVVLQDRREFEARVVGADEQADLAALRIETKGESLPHLDLKDSDLLEVGDLVLAIGNPFGVGQSVTSGIVSALARTRTDINDLNYFIQTDAAINPGNSGGALVTMDGKLIGINAAIFSRDGGNMGIGFAVPSNMVRAFIAAVAAGHKTLPHLWTGIKGQEVTPDVATSLNMARPTGVLVSQVQSASPGDRAGIKAGDVITALDGKPVEDPAAFRYRLATVPMSKDVAVEILRHGKTLSVRLALESPPENPARDEALLKGQNPLAGAMVANVSPALIEETGLRGVTAGVVLTKVSADSNAGNLGLQPGDVLLAINGKKMESVSDVQNALKKNVRRWQMNLSRGGATLNLIVGG